MEDILDVYTASSYDDKHPLIAMDEASKELHRHVPGQEPQPLKPGRPRREDYHYERNGVQSLFMFLSGYADDYYSTTRAISGCFGAGNFGRQIASTGNFGY